MNLPYPQSGQFAMALMRPANHKGERYTEHYWFPTAQDANAHQQYWKEQNDLGADVYYSTGGFAGELGLYKGRTKDHCVSQRSLFIDIDAKDFATGTVAEAWDALITFLDKSKLVEPSVVIGSGNGLHVYWHCSEDIPLNIWQNLANTLKSAATLLGFKIDPTCTADRTRILRVPGFTNHKRDKLVRQMYPNKDDVVEQYTLEELCESLQPFLSAAPVTPTKALEVDPLAGITFAVPTEYSAGAPVESAFGSVEDTERPAHSWEETIRRVNSGHCPLMKAAIEQQATVRYDLWAGLLTIAQCMDTPEQAYEDLCGEHKDYDLQTCINKAASFGGPRSCNSLAQAARDSGLGDTPCAGCPHQGKITSPVQLDRLTINTPTVVETALPSGEVVIQQLDALPEGYERHKGGLPGIWVKAIVPDGDEGGTKDVQVMLMREDIRLVGVSRLGDNTEQAMTYKFQYLHPMQGVQRFSLSAEAFSGKGDGITAKLMNANVSTSYSDPNWRAKVSKFLSALITQHIDKKVAPLTVTQFGPQFEGDTGFVLGEFKYNADGTKEVVNLTQQAEYAASHMPSPPVTPQEVTHRQGLIAEWNSQLKEVLPHDTLHAIDRFVLATGFATALSPYITPTRVRGGMVIVNYNGSGSGKSTMVERATHIWTGGDAKFITPNTTQMKFLETRVQVANALPTAWDELCKEDETGAKLLSSLALCSTDRKQRERLNDVSRGTWNTWFYATMNPDPHALLGSRGLAADGALHRVLSLKTDPARFGSGETLRQAQKKAHALEQWGHRNGGHVGTAWVEHFLPRLDQLRERYEFWERRFQTECPELLKGSGERFAVAICVTTMVAAEAAKEAGLHPFNVEGLFAYAQIALQRSVETITDHTITDEELLDELLSTSQDVMLIKDTAKFSATDRVPQRKVCIRVDTDMDEPVRVSISKRYIREWAVGKKIDAVRVVAAISALPGVLFDRVNLTRGAATATVQASCYIIPEEYIRGMASKLLNATNEAG